MHTGFQVLLYNSYNSTSVICLHTICSLWPIDRPLTGATILSQSGPRSNGNEWVLCIPSPSYDLMSYIKDIRWDRRFLPFCRDAVGIFYSRLGCFLWWYWWFFQEKVKSFYQYFIDFSVISTIIFFFFFLQIGLEIVLVPKSFLSFTSPETWFSRKSAANAAGLG